MCMCIIHTFEIILADTASDFIKLTRLRNTQRLLRDKLTSSIDFLTANLLLM